MSTSNNIKEISRISLGFLSEFTQCPSCKGKLALKQTSFVCLSCQEPFHSFRGRPVLIRKDHDLFPPDAYSRSCKRDGAKSKKTKLNKLIKGMVPSSSLNLVRHGMFKHISQQYDKEANLVLVVGCGGQREELRHYFSKDEAKFVFCDIDRNADVDIFCDAHELVFQDEIFDGVITTAVLECVLSPEKVVSEIFRVLKPDGFVYSEIPFLQSVQEGAYDFTRLSMTGHRLLFQQFKEEKSGMVAGPGTVLVWSLIGFAKGMFVSLRLSQLAGLLARGLFFWLKYFDYFMRNNALALDGASCTYFYGKKTDNIVPLVDIIQCYEGRNIQHI